MFHKLLLVFLIVLLYVKSRWGLMFLLPNHPLTYVNVQVCFFVVECFYGFTWNNESVESSFCIMRNDSFSSWRLFYLLQIKIVQTSSIFKWSNKSTFSRVKTKQVCCFWTSSWCVCKKFDEKFEHNSKQLYHLVHLYSLPASVQYCATLVPAAVALVLLSNEMTTVCKLLSVAYNAFVSRHRY